MQLQVEKIRFKTTNACRNFLRGGCRDEGERWRINRREAVVAACGRSMSSSLTMSAIERWTDVPRTGPIAHRGLEP